MLSGARQPIFGALRDQAALEMRNGPEHVEYEFSSGGWEHVILSGDFDWHSGAADRKIARALNIRTARDWGT